MAVVVVELHRRSVVQRLPRAGIPTRDGGSRRASLVPESERPAEAIATFLGLDGEWTAQVEM